MPWKTTTVDDIAHALKINPVEVREKQRLMGQVRSMRKRKRLSQAALAKKTGISQARIVQIESGTGTSKVTFDVLLNILSVLIDITIAENGSPCAPGTRLQPRNGR